MRWVVGWVDWLVSRWGRDVKFGFFFGFFIRWVVGWVSGWVSRWGREEEGREEIV